jgi:tetratricopeptide (TPR) repeat protein
MKAARLIAIGLVLVAGCTTRAAQQKKDAEDIQKETSAKELLARGEASGMAGDMARAEQYFVAALKAGANERHVTQRLLAVCATDHRYPVALDYADNYLRHHPTDTELRFARAALYAATGDRDQAEIDLQQVIAEHPEWAEAHFELATVLREGGSAVVRADHHYREYLKLDPKGPHAEAARGHLLKAVP